MGQCWSRKVRSADPSRIFWFLAFFNELQYRFRSIKSATYRGAHGILLLFDCTDRDWSFKNVPYVFEELAENAPKTAQIILVATKTDQVNKRQISYDEAKKLADRMQVPYIETSAKENINVTETFKLLVHNIENALSSHQSPSDIVQVDVPEKPALLDQEPKTWKYRCIIS